jgi:hypothetical protein
MILQRDAVRVHGHIDGAGRGTEQDEDSEEHEQVRCLTEQRQRPGRCRQAQPHHPVAPPPGDQPGQGRGREHRAQRQAEQREPELARPDVQGGLLGRDPAQPARTRGT